MMAWLRFRNGQETHEAKAVSGWRWTNTEHDFDITHYKPKG